MRTSRIRHWTGKLVEQSRSSLPIPQGLDLIDPLLPDPSHRLDRDFQVLRCDSEDLPLWHPTADCELPPILQDSLMGGPKHCSTMLILSRPWRLRCQHAQVMRQSGTIIHDPSNNWTGMYGRSWPLWPAQRLRGAVINLTNHGNPNLYHWLFNPTLQLIRQMEAEGINPAKAVGLYLGPAWSATWPSYIQQTLTHLSLERLPRLRRAVCPEYLYMSLYASSAVCPSQSQFLWLRRRLAPPRVRSGLRLYLGRASARRRRLLNERALMAALEPLGFTCIPDPESLDFNDQCRLLAEADVVVAPHGAALSLLFCCAPGTTLLEIHTPNYSSPLYAWMAFFGSLQYMALLAEPRSNPAEPSMDDLWVDPQLVLDQLSKWRVD